MTKSLVMAPSQHPLNRRSWLKLAGVAAGGYALSGGMLPLFAQTAAAKKLITRQEKPFNAEPALDVLTREWITPWESFFVRSHGDVPQVNLDAYRLKIEGLVEHPREYRAEELGMRNSAFPTVSTMATLTCAGNRRAEFAATHQQKVPGVGWDGGAIGNAEWSGVRLSDLLKAAGVKPEAKHVWFEGLDGIEHQGASHPFGGSIPLAQAMADSTTSPGAIICSRMNGQPLTAEHGAPLRAVVPGFIGARSVKWISRIIVSDQPSTNRFLAREYKLLREGTDAEIAATPPVYEMALNSVITTGKKDGDRLTLRGFALPQGQLGRVIERVELTADAGKTWTPAEIVSPAQSFCWTLWTAEVPAGANASKVAVRAVDNRGETQPMTVPWNIKGYQYNAWHNWSVPQA
ncbi:MAG TPA: sulfite oxidase [Planctomycetaceae bacterium]|nr:sulfite oxidase [Planctomycetaceae bacterium]